LGLFKFEFEFQARCHKASERAAGGRIPVAVVVVVVANQNMPFVQKAESPIFVLLKKLKMGREKKM
jgi:hypothetical protein